MSETPPRRSIFPRHKWSSPSKTPPATIDEKHSLRVEGLPIEAESAHDLLLADDLDEAFRLTSSGMRVHSMRLYTVKLGPCKKHMVQGHLIPTVRSAVGFLQFKSRRISIEVQGPPDMEPKKEGPSERTELTDAEAVNLRIFKRRRKGAPDTPKSADDDDVSVASSVGGSTTGDAEDGKEWRENRSYRLEDVSIVKSHGRTLEVKCGAGQETVVRDFKFESEADARSFEHVVEKMVGLERERAQRQIASYKQAKRDSSTPADKGPKLSMPVAVAAEMNGTESAGRDDRINILVEIVSATDVPVADVFSTDAYVGVRMGGKEIHRTSVIPKNLNPIWTLQEGSLFLLSTTPEDFFAASGGMTFIMKDFDQIGSDDVLGSVYVSLDELLKADGERKGYEIIPEKVHRKKKEHRKGILYLRMRQASEEDIKFIESYKKNPNKVGLYVDETFVPIRPPPMQLLKRQTKKNDTKEVLHRVKPFPDPDREQETKWMTEKQIYEESLKPSTHWIEGGSGKLGKVYVEILGCEKLPNMDSLTLNVKDKTDAFACLVFEDCVANTDVIGNSLSPRWMPWSQRAFAFNVTHPSSSLLVAMFDYDPELSPLQIASRATGDLHDPIGRIDIHLSNFIPETTYTLAYPLYYGETPEQRVKQRGTIWIRLRLEWVDRFKAFLAAVKPPDQTVVSVARGIDFQVAHYTTEGPTDEQEFNLVTLTKYIEELQSYEILMAYISDAAMTVWLWRGHYHVTVCGKELHLPLHSLTAFVWGVIVSWDFNRFPSFVLFSIGWALLATNEYVNNNPSPWHKVRSYWGMVYAAATRQFFTSNIPPNYKLEKCMAYQRQAEARLARWKREKELAEENEQKIRKELGADVDYTRTEDVDITSKKKGNVFKQFTDSLNILKPVLHPIQLQLGQIVIAVRIVKSVVLWEESYYAWWIVTACFTGSIAGFWVPFDFLLRWLLRIGVFLVLGPWMAIVDRLYFKENPNMTDQERDEAVRKRLKSRYEQVKLAASNYQIRRERAIKLKSMKKYMFGKYHLRVPRFAEDLCNDIPLPQSYSKPYDRKKEPPVEIKVRKYGQLLVGDMIPRREIQVSQHHVEESHHRLHLNPIKLVEEEGKRALIGKDLGTAERIPLLGHAFGRMKRKTTYDAVKTEEEEEGDKSL